MFFFPTLISHMIKLLFVETSCLTDTPHVYFLINFARFCFSVFSVQYSFSLQLLKLVHVWQTLPNSFYFILEVIFRNYRVGVLLCVVNV